MSKVDRFVLRRWNCNIVRPKGCC